MSTAPLVTAFAAAVVSAARRHSQTLPGGRLNPPLTLVLDEAANVAPLPDLPTLMADGGGRGITTWTFVQSFSQLRSRWGRDGADTIWGASTAKIILGGCTEADDLERISRSSATGGPPAAPTPAAAASCPQATTPPPPSRERERILPVPDLAASPPAQDCCSTGPRRQPSSACRPGGNAPTPTSSVTASPSPATPTVQPVQPVQPRQPAPLQG